MLSLKKGFPNAFRYAVMTARHTSNKVVVEGKLTPEITNKRNLTKYLSGYQRFHNHYFKKNPEVYNNLQNSQSPSSVVIGCSDSRVDPAIITDSKPGDLFVVRNVANLVGPYVKDGGHHGTASAIEYAVKVLKVKNIIVLGHSKCGGIQGLMDGNTSQFDFVGDWMSIAEKAKQITMEEHADSSREVQLRACGTLH
ncbi:hypothetical protein HDV06_004989 [Boothiomyces sp. JEL0866]|nr:hypothetical protein HDV06_004956 [Boothiomyces sp. JEL0866]KAJ3325232.1 hypothetical protein HDV06_004989 [Boothiomyces sp. JEL0866]